jgi:succinyl-CoA synthetase beta subunit
LYEHQAKAVFARFGIPVPKGRVCHSLLEVEDALMELGPRVALKAQVLVGGRGKAGGVRLADSQEQALEAAESLLGSQVKGELVRKLLVEERLDVAQEMYLGAVADTHRLRTCPVLMFSDRGGVDIETMAVEGGSLLRKVHVDPRYGLFAYQVRSLLKDLPPDVQAQAEPIVRALYRIYWEMDAELTEINPLVLTGDGRLVAVDARLNVDTNALFRHPEVERNYTSATEERAARARLSYVELDGDIGIISNGAGLTMATMDMIQLAGGRPANFLDEGDRILAGGIYDGLCLILDNPRVKAIFINVFGGGVRCDVIAEKIVEALEKLPELDMPIVVCLQGRNSEEARTIMERATYENLHFVPDFYDAIETVVSVVRERS